MTPPPIRPTHTTINGKDAVWSAELYRRWDSEILPADPRFVRGRVERANYYTPRPYVDEYNTGSPYAGFVYTVWNGAGVPEVWEWHWVAEETDPRG